MRERFLDSGTDVKERIGYIPNYVTEIQTDENGIERPIVRQISDEEFIEQNTMPCPEGLIVDGVAFNPDRVNKLQAIDELEQRIDNLNIDNNE